MEPAAQVPSNVFDLAVPNAWNRRGEILTVTLGNFIEHAVRYKEHRAKILRNDREQPEIAEFRKKTELSCVEKASSREWIDPLDGDSFLPGLQPMNGIKKE